MKRVAEFEKISLKQFQKDWIDTFGNKGTDIITEIYNNIKLPRRATTGSAGHDISIPFDINIASGDKLKIPTGIRCKMNDDYVMLIFPRSSLGIKKGLVILNTIPVVDSDYYNADNEGHIFICIKNTSNEVMKLSSGDNIVQAIFVNFGVADMDNIGTKRTGGIGSTSKHND